MVKQNKQANISYIRDRLMPNRENKSNRTSFEVIFDEIQVTKVFHRRCLNTLSTDRNHDRRQHRHTNDIYHYPTTYLYLET